MAKVMSRGRRSPPVQSLSRHESWAHGVAAEPPGRALPPLRRHPEPDVVGTEKASHRRVRPAGHFGDGSQAERLTLGRVWTAGHDRAELGHDINPGDDIGA